LFSLRCQISFTRPLKKSCSGIDSFRNFSAAGLGIFSRFLRVTGKIIPRSRRAVFFCGGPSLTRRTLTQKSRRIQSKLLWLGICQEAHRPDYLENFFIFLLARKLRILVKASVSRLNEKNKLEQAHVGTDRGHLVIRFHAIGFLGRNAVHVHALFGNSESLRPASCELRAASCEHEAGRIRWNN